MIIPIASYVGQRVLGAAALTGAAYAGYKTGQVIRQKLRPQPPVTYQASRVSPSQRQEGTRPKPSVTKVTEGPKRPVPVSKPKPKPSPGSGGGAGRPRGGGTSKRTRMVQQRLRLAEQRAARGDVQGAANYAAAALTLQRGGRGTAKSTKRVAKVAGSYSKKAGRSRVENQMAGSRIGTPPRKGKGKK